MHLVHTELPGDGARGVPLLGAALRDSSVAVRVAALSAITAARVPRAQALALIGPATRDANPVIRGVAYQGLGALLTVPEVAPQVRSLLQAASTDPDTTVRRIARRAANPLPPGDANREPRRRGSVALPAP